MRCPLCNHTKCCWTAVPAVEHLICQWIVCCPSECGWQGTLSEYEKIHYTHCPRRFGISSFCGEQMSLEQFEQVHKVNGCCCSSCSYCGEVKVELLKEFHKVYDCCMFPLRAVVVVKSWLFGKILHYMSTNVSLFMFHVGLLRLVVNRSWNVAFRKFMNWITSTNIFICSIGTSFKVVSFSFYEMSVVKMD